MARDTESLARETEGSNPSRSTAPQAPHCRPLWTVEPEVRHLPLEMEAEARASWLLARLAPRRRAGKGQMRMPPAVFASVSTRRIRTRPCNGRSFTDSLLGPEFMRTLALSAGQPIPARREPSPGIRASLLTQAKFFQHERSCRSPPGDTQPLRLSAILASTFYPPGHCCAKVRG
jgi:hypothetical protein